MSKTSLKAMTVQNVSGLPKHNNFNNINLKNSFKLYFLNYQYNLKKFYNVFVFSLFFKIDSKFFIKNNFKMVSFHNNNKNYLFYKNFFTKNNNKYKNRFCFFFNKIYNYSIFFKKYLNKNISKMRKKLIFKKNNLIFKKNFKKITKNNEKINFNKKQWKNKFKFIEKTKNYKYTYIEKTKTRKFKLNNRLVDEKNISDTTKKFLEEKRRRFILKIKLKENEKIKNTKNRGFYF